MAAPSRQRRRARAPARPPHPAGLSCSRRAASATPRNAARSRRPSLRRAPQRARGRAARTMGLRLARRRGRFTAGELRVLGAVVPAAWPRPRPWARRSAPHQPRSLRYAPRRGRLRRGFDRSRIAGQGLVVAAARPASMSRGPFRPRAWTMKIRRVIFAPAGRGDPEGLGARPIAAAG